MDRNEVVSHISSPSPSGAAARAPSLSGPSCQPWKNQNIKLGIGIGPKYAHIHVVVPSTPGSAPAPSGLPHDTPSLLGINTVVISLAFIISAVAIVCAANKWYEYLFVYSPPILEEYRERQLVYEERQESRRRAAAIAAAAAEEEEAAAHRLRVEELYTSIASTSYDDTNPRDSSGSSPLEIHPASPISSSTSFGSPSRAHHGHVLLSARSGSELHISR